MKQQIRQKGEEMIREREEEKQSLLKRELSDQKVVQDIDRLVEVKRYEQLVDRH